MEGNILLSVRDLSVEFTSPRGTVKAVNGVSYDVCEGEILGIVGESGSGKSTSAYAMMRLLGGGGRVTGGTIEFAGRDMLSLSERELRAVRGGRIGMIFQDPMQCLDPVFTIGSQLVETLEAHGSVSRREARERSAAMLTRVGIHNAGDVMGRYQFELSGGMRQRVMIAMALLCSPELLIADEPTTALDVTIQDQILGLLKSAAREDGMAMVFITHNFGIVADICDRVAVMYGGEMMEKGAVDDLFYSPAHPYTEGLLKAIPRADVTARERLVPIEGTPIDMFSPPAGCPFSERCPGCMDICRQKKPPVTELGGGHEVSCWRSCGEAS